MGEGSLCKPDPSVEAQLLSVLCELSLTLPMSSTALCSTVAKRLDNRPVSHDVLTNLLLKFATQQIIRCGRSQVIQKIKIALFIKSAAIVSMALLFQSDTIRKLPRFIAA